jgi:hypothetical protein
MVGGGGAVGLDADCPRLHARLTRSRMVMPINNFMLGFLVLFMGYLPSIR